MGLAYFHAAAPPAFTTTEGSWIVNPKACAEDDVFEVSCAGSALDLCSLIQHQRARPCPPINPQFPTAEVIVYGDVLCDDEL